MSNLVPSKNNHNEIPIKNVTSYTFLGHKLAISRDNQPQATQKRFALHGPSLTS